MFHALCVLGHPVSLDKAAQGMGIEGKSTGIEGSEVPQLWAEGRHTEVLDYNTQDANATLELARICEDGGAMKWVTRKGTLSRMPLSKGWLSVGDARLLPEPDTFLDEPITQARGLFPVVSENGFLTWLQLPSRLLPDG